MLALSFIALLIFATLGIYDRPQNDDYYYLADRGVTPHDNFNWQSNGRLASLVSYYLLYPLPHILQLAPGFSIILLVMSLAVFLSAILRWINNKKNTRDLWLISITAASCASVAILFMLPGIYATFYWFAALPPHTWSFCFALLYVGILLHRLLIKRWPLHVDVIVFLLVSFIVGTFYEAASLILICASVITLILLYWRRIEGPLRVAWLSTVGSILSLAFLFLSPGAIRRRELSATTNHDTMLQRILQLPDVLFHNYFVTLPHYLQNPELLLVLVAAGMMIGLFFIPKKLSFRSTLNWSAITIAGAFIFISIDMCVVWVGLNEVQAVREYFSLVLGLAIAAILVGIFIGLHSSGHPSPFRRGVSAGVAVSIMVVILLLNFAYIPDMRIFRGGIINYAHLWDKRDKYIRLQAKSGTCHIRTYALLINGSWYVKAGKGNWVGGGAMHHYYKLPGNDKTWCSIYSTHNIRIWDTKYYEDPSRLYNP